MQTTRISVAPYVVVGLWANLSLVILTQGLPFADGCRSPCATVVLIRSWP
jgi:hypothetical protein